MFAVHAVGVRDPGSVRGSAVFSAHFLWAKSALYVHGICQNVLILSRGCDDAHFVLFLPDPTAL